MQVRFSKMQGLGNDFVLLDARATPIELTPVQVQRLADRRYGVGCDQVLLIDRPSLPTASVRYRVFNADGSAAQHCGNGVRCVARYLAQHTPHARGALGVEIGGQVYQLQLEATGLVRVDMGEPCFDPAALPLRVPARLARYPLALDASPSTDLALNAMALNAALPQPEPLTFGAVCLGNPHAVFAVASVEHAPVVELGAALQDHPAFPERVNVGFMQVLDAGHIRLRVFERGAGETPACGTGACAAVAVGRVWGELAARVEVLLGGGSLTIDWPGPGHRLWMTGPAQSVFEGSIEL